MGTKGRAALSGLRIKLEEAVGALETAKREQRAAEFLARSESINGWALKETAKVLDENIEQMKKMGADGASKEAINAIATDGRRQVQSIARLADQRLKRLREQYQSGDIMTPE
jgi:hypothetical protein